MRRSVAAGYWDGALLSSKGVGDSVLNRTAVGQRRYFGHLMEHMMVFVLFVVVSYYIVVCILRISLGWCLLNFASFDHFPLLDLP